MTNKVYRYKVSIILKPELAPIVGMTLMLCRRSFQYQDSLIDQITVVTSWLTSHSDITSVMREFESYRGKWISPGGIILPRDSTFNLEGPQDD